MSRATMAALILSVRDLIGDPVTDPAGTEHFTGDQIEAALDRRSRPVNEYPLSGVPVRDAQGQVTHLRFLAGRGPWEEGATLLDPQLRPIAEADYTEDAVNGSWVFDAAQDSVSITGTTFDLYGAAADLLDQWIISGSSSAAASGGAIVEWETDGQRVKRAQATTEDRRALSASYRAQSLPVTGTFERTDLNSARWSPW